MTHPDPGSPHAVITAALRDWQLLTDPIRPDLTAAADRIEMYLISSGYRITPDTQEPPMTDQTAEQRLRAAHFIAHHWRQQALTRGWPVTAHALAVVSAALNGELDPSELGIDDDQHEAFRAALNQPHTETIHACPPKGSGTMPCCDRSPFEAPRTDRITSYSELVTCQPDTQPSEPDVDRQHREP